MLRPTFAGKCLRLHQEAAALYYYYYWLLVLLLDGSEYRARRTKKWPNGCQHCENWSCWFLRWVRWKAWTGVYSGCWANDAKSLSVIAKSETNRKLFLRFCSYYFYLEQIQGGTRLNPLSNLNFTRTYIGRRPQSSTHSTVHSPCPRFAKRHL